MSRREPAASPFRDLSNLRTPRPNPKHVPASPTFFTASKTPLQAPTPTPLRLRRPGDGAPTPTPLGRRLRALEVDQSRSARRAESGRERALRSFAASASSWLSLLLRDPAACGCSPAATGTAAAAQPCAAGERDALGGDRARGVRSPKRRRGGGDRGGEKRKEMTPAMIAALRDSLREVCSLDDVTERMGRYMSKGACEEVLVMIFQVCKSIDEGRLKMKAQCPLVTDLRLKEKATRIFMCYNPDWLRIGLHIVHGGDSLMQCGLGKRDKEVHFLKLILEKQMFSQIMTAKFCAHKKVVEGHNVQGYSEASGNIILKRIFLFVAALDRAKIESALPLEAGIDGLDGGSPLLFCHQGQVKSSRQIIQESLGEAMHGEGDLLMHLATMGYKLNYQQPALSEYDFTVRSLFEDLQDGIILCRIVQLLISDASIILNVIAPSDTKKKRLSNCTTAIRYIKQARVPLSDPDGVTISAEDIITGDKELILSLLWNLFIHKQLPLLASTSLSRELTRLGVPLMSMEQRMPENKSHMVLLYDWVQVIRSKYGITVESSPQFDRRALNCLVNYYLNIDVFPNEETQTGCRKELFTCHELDTLTDITSCPSSKMGKVFADVLQDIPGSNILADGVLIDEKSAILLLAFLSSHLTNDKRLDQLKNLINMRLHYESPQTNISARYRSGGKNDVKYQLHQRDNKDGSCTNQEWAATIIQSQTRSFIAKNKYCKRKKAIFILQGAMKAWSATTLKRNRCPLTAAATTWQAHGSSSLQTYTRLCVLDQCQQRKCHQSLELKIVLHSVIRLQRWWRKFLFHQSVRTSVISIQSFVRGWLARKRVNRIVCCINIIQRWWRKVLFLESRTRAVTIIQTHFRRWVARQDAIKTRNCITTIQRWWRKVLFLKLRRRAVIVIQAHFRGWVARQAAFRTRKVVTTIQSFVKAFLVRKASKQEVAHIRSRLQKSSSQVDDSMRLINRLVAALSQLRQSRSTHRIRQACTTLSTATEYSKKCCETLVTAGAVDILLKQIHLLNRGIPDQEILKQVFLTFRNIARYPNLRQVLVNTPESVEIIFQELLRSKSAGFFFIASDVLKKLCESKGGHETARALHHHIKMLRNLVQDLEKKVELDKRNGRTGVVKENNLRRLREAATLYHLLTW
ncbi:hypothetical protein PVAP13_2NG513900 [Panicum virgatum]|uniref:Calponin-homology (CH) domain-containing protein n=1 Tax=Panicum virgatum TaxID=38727 RepID=A0A8T0VSE9_PANVG|nr:hypothetical protein PVAP13_2NG513900 [Panicum virgatum]